MASLKAKVSLITGASSGIGAGTAVLFASLGSHLSLTGRNLINLKETANKCVDAGLAKDKIHLIQADLSQESDAQLVIEQTTQHFGKLDVLVNSAGIQISGSTLETKLEDYDKIMNTNVRSVFYLTQLAIPHIVKTKGTIVNVSSVASLRAFPGVVAYNMSKAAIDQLTRTTALELASQHVRVNAVNPGVVVTEIHKRGGMDDEHYQQFLEHCKQTHALGRVGTVAEVAKAIAFLVSDDSSFITGQTLPVDGGRSVMCLDTFYVKSKERSDPSHF